MRICMRACVRVFCITIFRHHRHLHQNGLEGTVPKSLSHLTHLRFLYVLLSFLLRFLHILIFSLSFSLSQYIYSYPHAFTLPFSLSFSLSLSLSLLSYIRWLSTNSLSGTIPMEITHSDALEHLCGDHICFFLSSYFFPFVLFV